LARHLDPNADRDIAQPVVVPAVPAPALVRRPQHGTLAVGHELQVRRPALGERATNQLGINLPQRRVGNLIVVFFGGLDRLDRQREPARSQALAQLGRELIDAELLFHHKPPHRHPQGNALDRARPICRRQRIGEQSCHRDPDYSSSTSNTQPAKARCSSST
jgi:hypothetical protein